MPADRAPEAFAVVLFAGGRARRLPHKLERIVGGVPLLLRTARNVHDAGPLAIACSTPPPAIVAACRADLVLPDRSPYRGPLAALADAARQLEYAWLAAVAADLPFVDASVLRALASAREPGDEAVVAEHDGIVEPLCALYERAAILREAPALLANGALAMHELVRRLRVRSVAMPSDRFVNVNTEHDLLLAEEMVGA